MFNSASNVIMTFINEIEAQRDKGITSEDIDEFIVWTQKMILDPQEQIIKSNN